MKSSQWAIGNRQWSPCFQRVFLLVCLLTFTNFLFAQKISTILSKDKIIIGEQISVVIKIDDVAANQVQQDFNFPDTVNHLEILSDSVDSDGPAYIHTLTITSFDSGYWQFPSYEVILSGGQRLVSEPLNIAVLPVDVSNLADYHDIKDILDVKAGNNWWIVSGIVLLGLLSLFVFLWFVTNKSKSGETILQSGDLTQLYSALIKKIQTLEKNDLSDRASVVYLYKELSQSIRLFIDAAYRQNTLHLTSGEHMLKMKGKFPDAGSENNYFQLLRLADAVKFAKYIPPADETRSEFPLLYSIIEQVYQQNKSAN